MSENNSGAPDNRNSEQGRDKRQRFDPARQDTRKNNRNSNHRRRNSGQRQGGYDKKRDNAEVSQDNKGQNKQNNRFKRDQNQGGEKRKQFGQDRKPKNKRPREIDPEVAKTVKKVETIDDIRSDNARITKEIYLEIASLKNINLN